MRSHPNIYKETSIVGVKAEGKQESFLNKYKQNILLVLVVLAVVATTYPLFCYTRIQSGPVNVDDAIAQIEAALHADPNYRVTEFFDIHASKPTYFNLDSLIYGPLSRMQIIIRNSSGTEFSSWKHKLHMRLKWLPGKIGAHIFPFEERKRINIYALEPSAVELEKIKTIIESLRLPRSISIHFSAYRPER